MDTQPDVDITAFEKHLAAEARDAVVKGGLVSALLGFLSGAILLALLLAGAVDNLTSPVVFALSAGAYSLLLFFVAKTGRLEGGLLYLLILPFVMLPTFFFILTHFELPSGAASYITGPISYLYFHLIFMTAFLFDARLSILAGIVSAIGYEFSYSLAVIGLSRISVADPILRQDLTAAPIYLFKGVMMVFAGFLVAAMSGTVRRLIERTVREAHQKDRISRLFGQYVSQEVKDRIVSEKSELVGERRNVVILFSDLRGFSSFSEGREAEAIVALLNRYFDAMVGCISAHGGTVDKFMGDAVMAVFGGLVPLRNPAEAAAAAALAMRAKLAELNADLTASGLAPLENGIGLHYGEVLQGPIGSQERKEFTVIGDAVNVASRLESLTRDSGHRILLSEAVRERLPVALAARTVAVGPTKLKGKQAEVNVFAIPPLSSSAPSS
jgi:class 3 adenylate cyclase